MCVIIVVCHVYNFYVKLYFVLCLPPITKCVPPKDSTLPPKHITALGADSLLLT